jgi:hypothetical protein
MIQMKTITIRGRESGGVELRREVSVPAEVLTVSTIGDSRSKVGKCRTKWNPRTMMHQMTKRPLFKRRVALETETGKCG